MLGLVDMFFFTELLNINSNFLFILLLPYYYLIIIRSKLGAEIDPGLAFNVFPSNILHDMRFEPTTFWIVSQVR